MIKVCFCGSALVFKECCQPIINGNVDAKNAEALMRSRFSAYSINNYQYILETYSPAKRTKLTINELATSAQDTKWLSLQVLTHHCDTTTANVEFKAFYQLDNAYHVMHEVSDFIFEAGKWWYADGVIQKGSGEYTPQRNSQCLCGSTKKFKKCCGR